MRGKITALILFIVVFFITPGGAAEIFSYVYDYVKVSGTGISFMDNFTNDSLNLWKSEKKNWKIDLLSATPSKDNTSLVSSLEDDGTWSCQVAGEMDWKNYKVEATVFCDRADSTISKWIGICGRLTAAVNYDRQFYLFVYDSCDGELRLENYHGAYEIRDVLGTAPSGVTAPGWHKMAMEFNGNEIRCYFDKKMAFDVQDNTHSKGLIGLYQMKSYDRAFNEEAERNKMLTVLSAQPGTHMAAKTRLDFAKKLQRYLRKDSSVSDFQKRITEYENVIQELSGSPEARQAKLRIAYLKNELFGKATADNITYYDDIVVEYRSSSPADDLIEATWKETFENADAASGFSFVNSSLSIKDDTTAPSKDKKVGAFGSLRNRKSICSFGSDDWCDYKVETRIKTQHVGGDQPFWQGLCARVSVLDQYYQQYYLFVYDGCDGELWLERYQTKVPTRTVLATAPSGVKTTGWHIMTMELKGDSITCLWDGKEVLSAKDDTLKTGRAGLYQRRASGQSYQERLQAFEEVIAAYPGSQEAKEAKFRQGMVLQGLRGDYRWQALDKFAEFISAYGSEDNELSAKVQCNLAGLVLEQAYEGKASYDQAIAECEKVLSYKNANEEEIATAKLMKAESQYLKKLYLDCRALCQEIIDRHFLYRRPCMLAQYHLGCIHFVKKDYEQAKESFEELISNFTDEDNWPGRNLVGMSLYYKAQVLMKQRKFDEAKDVLKQIIQRYPQSKVSDMSQKILDRM